MGTTAPTCKSGSNGISWNSEGPVGPAGTNGNDGTDGATGPQGPPGPQGLSSAQYQAANAWAFTFALPIALGGFPFPNLPGGETLTITRFEYTETVSPCSVVGEINGDSVSYVLDGQANSWQTGLSLSISVTSDSVPSVDCTNPTPGLLTISGYTTPAS